MELIRFAAVLAVVGTVFVVVSVWFIASPWWALLVTGLFLLAAGLTSLRSLNG